MYDCPMTLITIAEPVPLTVALLAVAAVLFLFHRSVSNATLRASEKQYRLLFENCPQPMWFTDQQTNSFLEVNEAAVNAYGYSRQEFLAMKVCAIQVDDDPPAQKQHPGLRRHRQKDGEMLEVEMSIHAVRFQGRAAQFTLVRDITEQQKAQREIWRLNEELARNVREIETVFQSAPVGLAIANDPSCNDLRANAYLEKLLRLTPGANASMTRPGATPVPYRILRDGELVRLQEYPIREAVRTGRMAGPRTFTVGFDDGTKLEVVFQAEPLLDASGFVRGCVGSFTDVTENRRVEVALRESVERFQRVFYEAPLGMYLVAVPAMECVAVNRALCGMLGYDAEELRAMDCSQATHPEDREHTEKFIQGLLAGEKATYQIEKRYLRKDGEVVPTNLSATTIHNQNGEITHLLYMIEDITDRKRLEGQLRQSQKMEAVGRLAGGVAHDFNNLLTIILGHAALAMGAVEDHDWLQESLLEIQKAGERAATLTRQLLAFSRKQVLQTRLVNLNEVISGLSDMLRRLIGEDIRLTLTLETGLGSTKADPGQLEQVILNLAVNARDAMPAGGMLDIGTSNVEWKGVACVRLTVKDTGCGMDQETKSRIFEPFFTTKDLGRGTGLGLSTVYGIVEQSGGNIEVRSQPGMGASFDVILPRLYGTVEPQVAVRIPVPSGSGTVLLVEDEDGVRGLVAELLRKAGYTVLQAANGRDALEELERSKRTVDLLVTDVVMPEMSGPDLAARIMAIRPPIGVLFMSGYTDHPSFRGESLRDGSAFLHKPFEPRDLLLKVSELLGRR